MQMHNRGQIRDSESFSRIRCENSLLREELEPAAQPAQRTALKTSGHGGEFTRLFGRHIWENVRRQSPQLGHLLLPWQ